MNINESGKSPSVSAQTVQSSEVAVIKKQNKQSEEVALKLIEGIDENPVPRSVGNPTGKTLDIKA